MPSSAALPLAAVVTQFRIGTVLEPAQSTDITPSTTFRSVLESYHLDQRPDVGFGEWLRALKAGEQNGAGVGAGFLFQFAEY